MEIFHGGCLGCVNQAIKGIGYCDGCVYKSRANRHLPNLYRSQDDLLELKKLYEEIFMSNDQKDIKLGEWQIKTQPNLDMEENDSNRLEPSAKITDSGLLQYIPDEPMELPDNGAVQNKYGLTASGVKILNELREILIKAGY